MTSDGHISGWWYATALVVYITAGFFLKSVVLNWLVGPLFLLIVLYVVPTVLRTLTRKARTQ